MASPANTSSPSATEKATRETTRFGVRAVLAGIALALVAMPFSLTLLLVKANWAPLLQADFGARDSLHAYAVNHSGFVTLMKLISDSGSALAWQIMLGLVVLWLLWRRLPRLALFVVVTSVGSSLLNSGVKAAVARLRPVLPDPVDQAPGLSFPSGHSQAAIVGYAVLLLVFLPVLHGVWKRGAVIISVFMVLAVGYSRVALGVHYLSDVIGGFVLGAAWVAAMAAVFNAMRIERGHRPVELKEGLEPEQARRLGSRPTREGGDEPA